MNILQDTNSLETFWDDLVFLAARLKAEPTVKHLAGPVDTQLDSYDTLASADRNMRKRKIMMRAQKKTAEERVGALVEELHSATLYSVKQNTKDQSYSLLFTTNLSGFKKLSLVAQKEEFLRMQSILKLPRYSDDFRDAQNLVIEQAIAEIDEMLTDQKSFEELEMFHRVAIQAWKDEVNDVRNDAYGELIQTPGMKSKAKAWARTFFIANKATKKVSAEEKARLDTERLERKQKKLLKAQEALLQEQTKAQEKLAKEQAKALIDSNVSPTPPSSPPPSNPPGSNGAAPPSLQ